MALDIAVVLLGDDAPLPVDVLTQDVESRWTDLPYATGAEQDEGTVSFHLGSAWLAVGFMPAPVPWSDLEGPCSTSWLWPNAADALRPHRVHWIVTVLDEAPPVPRALLLTRITASVLATCPAAIGVLWRGSGAVLPKEFFIGVAGASALRDPPVELWVDFRVGRDGRKTSWRFTHGLEALGHMEFETEQAPEDPGELLERLISLARYVVAGNGVIRDGDTVARDAREKIRVEYSAFGHEQNVMRLEFPPPKWRSW